MADIIFYVTLKVVMKKVYIRVIAVVVAVVVLAAGISTAIILRQSDQSPSQNDQQEKQSEVTTEPSSTPIDQDESDDLDSDKESTKPKKVVKKTSKDKVKPKVKYSPPIVRPKITPPKPNPPKPHKPSPKPRPKPKPIPVPDPITIPKPPSPSKYDVGPPVAGEMLELVNAERKKRGIRPMSLHSKLQYTAQWKAKDMVRYKYFAHVKPGESEPNGLKLIRKKKVKCGWIAENLASTTLQYHTSRQAIKLWMKSPSHRGSILDSKYTRTGFGVYGNKVVQHFCEPR